MPGDLEQQMREDKILRNAALALIQADVSHLKSDFQVQRVTSRAATRMAEGIADVFEEAVEVAEDNRGALTALIAGIILWFARNPIMSLFSEVDMDETVRAEEYTETVVD